MCIWSHITVLCKIQISQTPVSLYYSMQEDLAIPTSESSLQVNFFLHYIAHTLHSAFKKSVSNIKQRLCNCSASVIQTRYEYENIQFEIMTRIILQNIFLFYNIAYLEGITTKTLRKVPLPFMNAYHAKLSTKWELFKGRYKWLLEGYATYFSEFCSQIDTLYMYKVKICRD